MKKVIGTITVFLIIYCACYITCEYNAYKAEQEIYLNIYSNEYGLTEDGRVIDKTSLSYFDGYYVKTKYENITDIADAERLEKISLSDKYSVEDIYFLYPEIKVYVEHNELIYEKKEYNSGIVKLLQRLEK